MHKHVSTGWVMWQKHVHVRVGSHFCYKRYNWAHACLCDLACLSVCMCIHVPFVLIMCVCLQWWLRGPDSCSVVWWSSPSGEGAGGDTRPIDHPQGARLYCTAYPRRTFLAWTMPCRPASLLRAQQHIQHTEFWSRRMQHHVHPSTSPPEPACSNTLTKVRTQTGRYSTMKRIHSVKF